MSRAARLRTSRPRGLGPYDLVGRTVPQSMQAAAPDDLKPPPRPKRSFGIGISTNSAGVLVSG
jgi:hypothetical protein